MSFSQAWRQGSERIIAWLQYAIPHHFVSRIVLRITRITTPWIKNALIRWFIAVFKVDMTEAEIGDYRLYPDFNAFFTRTLRSEVRPMATDDDVLVCPVDGTVSEAGDIARQQLFQAKGHDYSLADLLGGDTQLAEAFTDGCFATLYLSPRDYHRIHIPAEGTLRQMRYVPGRLFSVNPLTVRQVPNLFARNERVITVFDTEFGPMAVIMVGAINVACIETPWHGVVTPPHRGRIDEWQYQDPTLRYPRGDEIGRFNMGSTVIVLCPRDSVDLDEHVRAGAGVRMGQPLARIRGAA